MVTSVPAIRSFTRVVEAQTGVLYTVPLSSASAPVSGKPLTAKAPKAVVVTRRGKDLLVTHPDGQIDALEGFYEGCQGGVCALEVSVPGQASAVVITPETVVAE